MEATKSFQAIFEQILLIFKCGCFVFIIVSSELQNMAFSKEKKYYQLINYYFYELNG